MSGLDSQPEVHFSVGFVADGIKNWMIKMMMMTTTAMMMMIKIVLYPLLLAFDTENKNHLFSLSIGLILLVKSELENTRFCFSV